MLKFNNFEDCKIQTIQKVSRVNEFVAIRHIGDTLDISSDILKLIVCNHLLRHLL